MSWWNWQKASKSSVQEIVRSTTMFVKQYARYEFMTKRVVPSRVHEQLMKLNSLIAKGEAYMGYKEEVQAVHAALRKLDALGPNPDQQVAAQAFGELFVATSAVVKHLPIPDGGFYANQLELWGKKFGAIVEIVSGRSKYHRSGYSDEDIRSIPGM